MNGDEKIEEVVPCSVIEDDPDVPADTAELDEAGSIPVKHNIVKLAPAERETLEEDR